MALGGVGEAMLLGAAIGGGSKALLDPNADVDDILKSAALGGATGFLGGGGISNLLSSGTTAASAAALPASEGIPSIIQGAQAANAATAAPFAATGSAAPSVATNIMGGDALGLAKLGADVGPQALTGNVNPLVSQAVAPTSTFGAGMANAGPTGITNFLSDASSALGPQVSTGPSLFQDPLGYIGNNKMLAGASALAGVAGNPSRPEIEEEEEPWQGLRWRYRARGYADGGIASLPGYDMVVGETPMYARGGISDLGSYSDGGRMLKGAGDGMSDSIPGVIAGKRPARLADGEFVVPADVVSHLGNGSTDAGAKQLYKMMDKVRAARTGTKKQGREINPRRFMPA